MWLQYTTNVGMIFGCPDQSRLKLWKIILACVSEQLENHRMDFEMKPAPQKLPREAKYLFLFYCMLLY